MACHKSQAAALLLLQPCDATLVASSIISGGCLCPFLLFCSVLFFSVVQTLKKLRVAVAVAVAGALGLRHARRETLWLFLLLAARQGEGSVYCVCATCGAII